MKEFILTMARYMIYAAFIVLGMNYLLPFNTLMNTYGYYIRIQAALPLKADALLTMVNVIYQLGSIGFNGLSLMRVVRLTGYERSVGLCSGILSMITLAGIGCLIWTRTKSYLFIVLLAILSFANSALQSIVDNCSLYLTTMNAHKKNILYYGMGINVSGTVQALLLLVFAVVNKNDVVLVYGLYYVATLIIMGLTPLIYGLVMLCKRDAEPTDEANDLSPDADEDLPWNSNGTMLVILAMMNFVATMSLFPSLLLRQDVGLRYFNELGVLFAFNFAALCGNVMAIPKPQRRWRLLLGLWFIRLGTVMLFGYIHTRPWDERWLAPYIIGIVFNGFISGYTISSLFAITTYLQNARLNKILLVRLVNFAVSIGLIVGSTISLLFVSYM